MKTEIHECDRCHKKATTPEEKEKLALGSIKLGFETAYYSTSQLISIYVPNQKWEREWCRACRTELGILEDKVKHDTPAENIPSLEDMVREIVRQEINDR